MATQDSVIKLDGRVGELSLFKTKNGYSARTKKGMKGSRIFEDPRFERTRENLQEFRRAGKASKIIRSAFRGEIAKAADGRVTSRLISELMKVIRADGTNVRGERNVIDGESEFLLGFEFNKERALRQSMLAPFSASIDRATGSLTVDVPAFAPNTMVSRPPGSTHFQLTATACEIDFEAEAFVSKSVESVKVALDAQQQEAMALTSAIPNSTKPLFLTLGIQYYQLVNGQYYSMRSGGFNALAFVDIDGGK